MRVFLLGLCVFLAAVDTCFAWDNLDTHRRLTERSVEKQPAFRLDDYLKNKLSIPGGLQLSFNGNTLFKLILDGSDYEDSMSTFDVRAKNHFHNPTRFGFEAGLTDLLGFVQGHSAQCWAETVPENEWGYENFKAAYRQAMTAPTLEERRFYLQKAFRTVGHLMHLVQDMAVPAHTRNDLYPAHFDQLRKGFPFFSNPLEYYLEKHPEIVEAASVAEVPRFPLLEDFFDTGTYRSSGFQPASGIGVGLAEYTSSTFFSESTIFAESRLQGSKNWFPHPAKAETQRRDEMRDILEDYPSLWDRISELQGTGYALHYEALLSGDPERSVDHLAAHGFWLRFLSSQPHITWGYALDEACEKDYLKKLVPKSIAYSAGLLAHVFRGDIDFTYDPKTGQLEISNRSEEDMQGVFKLYYDKKDGTRAPLPGAEWTLTVPASTSTTVAGIALPRDAGVEDVLVLVFAGREGAEPNYVTGKESRLGLYRFAYRAEYKHYSLNYPTESDNMWAYDPGTGQMTREYRSSMLNESKIGEALISRDSGFFVQVQATPEMIKSLGISCAPDSWLTVLTNTYVYPGLVDYFKVEVSAGKWVWVYDSSGIQDCQGWPDVANPLIYSEGLWTHATGYVDDFRSLAGGHNLASECTLDTFMLGAGFNLNLVYNVDPVTGARQPRCTNAESLIAKARSYLPGYVDFYRQTVQRSLPYRDFLLNDAWLQYGFEARINQVIYLSGDGKRHVILDTPVTFRKPYGSDEFLVY